MKRTSLALTAALLLASRLVAQSAAPTAIAPPHGSLLGDAAIGAPELAARGGYKVGVKTVTMTNPGQIDVARTVKDKPAPVYDRKLTIEVWYPAAKGSVPEACTYTDYLGRVDQPGTLIPFTYVGRATRDAAPDKAGAPYPLVILSHGFPGSRYLMSYLGEHLASRGYIVAAIGHADSTFEDVSGFASTLVNRSLDQRFVIGGMLSLSSTDAFWKGACDSERVALIGYSMGGYGALRTLGAGANDRISPYAGAFAPNLLSSPADAGDARVKAAVLFAPWGGSVGGAPTGLWDKDSLKKVTVPTLWVAGSRDDVSGYEAIVSLYESAVNSRRLLLTYENALHNVAPNPAPPEAKTWGQVTRWADPVWDSRRIIGINMHFVTAFLDLNLRGNQESGAYLDVKVESSNDGVYALNKDGTKTAGHTYWPGFQPRSALGLRLRAD